MAAGSDEMHVNGLVCGRSDVAELYARMAADGVRDDEIDGAVGAPPDGRVDCEEVMEAALSFGERYGDFFLKLTGRPVPWLLDDSDPTTSFDKEVRRNIDRAIAVAKKDLKAMGLAPGDAYYETYLGTALYCFAFMQEKDELRFTMRENRPAAARYLSVVEAIGLAGLAGHMAREGGLGLGREAADTKREATALGALKLRAGICTERSKILYAIFDRAGLDAGFAHMTLKELQSVWMRLFGSSKKPPVTAEDYFGGHVVATIMAGGKALYFEPNMFLYNASYGDVAKRIGLREMFQCDLSNLTSVLYDEGEIKVAERFVDGGLLLGDTQLGRNLLYHRAIYYSKDKKDRGRTDSALDLFSSIMAEDPSFEAARMRICEIRGARGETIEAEKCVASLPDDAAQKHIMLEQLAIERKDWIAARKHLEVGMKLGINPAMVLPAMADVAEKGGDAKGALELFDRASQLAPMDPNIHQRIYALSRQAGDHAKALAHLRPLLLDAPMDTQRLLNCARELAALGRTGEAAQYFTRHTLLDLVSEWKGIGDYDRLAETVSELGMWDAADAAALLFVENKSLVVGAELVHLNVLARRVGAQDEAREAFSSFADRFAAAPHKSMLPPEIYWRIADVAERIGAWEKLHELCASFGAYSPFEVFAMHAAWKTQDRWLLEEDIVQFNGSMIELAGYAAEDRSPEGLRAICDAIEALPPDLVKENLYGTGLGRPFELLGETLEAGNDKRGALAAYLKAERMGLRDEGVDAAIERLEKSFEMPKTAQ
ncbi:MAG: hypothetical protein WC683_00410 [bacterium]